MRADDTMAFLLKYENVAWYQEGLVKILDRRVYPYEVRFEYCKSYSDVAMAIKNMVTQSAGPYTAAAMGMALAAYQARGLKSDRQVEFMKKASIEISNARVTTSSRMKTVTEGCLEVFKLALKEDLNPVDEIMKANLDSLERRYSKMQLVGDNLASLFTDDSVVMTQCYGETIVGTMLVAARKKGVKPKFIIPETRPFLQGARLTASVISDMGFDGTLITDNMAAWAFEHFGVNIFTSAADSITRDGCVVNKVGTLGLSILAKHFGIDYYVTGIPDDIYIKDIKIEFRDPEDVKRHLGKRATKEEVKAVYPAFDITPKENVSGYVTDKGILDFESLEEYYKGKERFY